MKAAFFIPVTKQPHASLQLLIELGNQGVSFLWYHPEPYKLAGLAIYHINHAITDDMLKQLIVSEGLDKEPVSAITVCYDVSEATLVPDMYFRQHEAAKMIELLHGHDNNAATTVTSVLEGEAKLIYRVSTSLHDQLSGLFPGAAFCHATEKQLLFMKDPSTVLHAIFFHNAIKAILFKNGRLQIVQYLHYQTATDAAYQLLNISQQYDINLVSLRVCLYGMIEKDSPLHKELYTYFPDIDFDKHPAGWEPLEEAVDYPEHYFSHLMALASCAS